MARPKWITPAGDLGIIAEREFYNLRLDAVDPDGNPLIFSVVGGSLPRGLSLRDDGFIEGIPTFKKVFIRGVPSDVTENVVSRFSVRVQSTSGQVMDRTFVLTVSGQDVPRITVSNQDLGQVYDGRYFEFPITAVDLDEEALTWSLKTGQLPPGLSLDPLTGIISGYVDVTADTSLGVTGWENAGWDISSWDFQSQSLTKTYQFSIGVTDGKDYDVRSFTLRVVAKSSLTADNTNITVDGAGDPTADADNKRNPVMLTQSQDLGIILHDNYFAFKFDAVDFDGDPIKFTPFYEGGFDTDLVFFDSVPFDQGDTPPPGLILNENTGWMYGFIPKQALIEQEYRFGIQAYKRDYPAYISEVVNFTMTIIGDLGKFVQWQVPDVLGTVYNGEPSELYVLATSGLTNEDGSPRQLYYRLVDDYSGGIPIVYNYYQTGDGTTTEYSIQTASDINGVEIPNFGIDYFISGKTITVTVNDVEVPYTLKKISPYDSEVDETVGSQTINSELERIVLDTPAGLNQVIKISVVKGFVDTETGSQNAGKLPQGLRLLPDGLIAGTSSFNGFTLDGGTCTFDATFNRNTSSIDETTFDREFTFTVEVYDLEGDIKTTKTFTIIVDRKNKKPYDQLYGVALPNKAQRELFSTLMDTIDDSAIYRLSDPNFGKSKDIRMLIATGLNPVTSAEMQAAITENHYDKKLGLGSIKTARALNPDGTVRYEVVYLDVRDFLENTQGTSISRTLTINASYLPDGYSNLIHPNSIENMRGEVYENIGQSNPLALPDWMSSKQRDGSILGLVNAAVICYAKPGEGDRVAFNLNRQDISFRQIEFLIDRYIWDNNRSKFYDHATSSFINTGETTFDKFSIDAGGTSLVATVDFAVSVPFSAINGRAVSTLAGSGAFDGVSTGFANKTIVFVRQEGFPNLEVGETGWERYTSPLDFDGYDTSDFDSVEQVPGYFDPVDERGAVWRVTVVDGVVFLVPELIVAPGERVNIRRGGQIYGGRSLFYDNSARPGLLYPIYSVFTGEAEGLQTTFDGNGTRFFDNSDVYALPDEDDQYVKFPQVGVFV